MGTQTGPGVFWWDTFDTLFDPSSLISYPGSGLILYNPLRYSGFSDWTMTDNTNLVAGSGISKYVRALAAVSCWLSSNHCNNVDVVAAAVWAISSASTVGSNMMVCSFGK